jgi:hypothetical protein
MLKRNPASGIRNGRHHIVGTCVVSIQSRYALTVKQANLALTAAFDAIAAAAPSNLLSLPSLAPMLSTFAVHS